MSEGIGQIIFSSELSSRPIKAVIEAAKQAEFEEELVYEVKPRNAFIRAARKIKQDAFSSGALLNADGILAHKYKDDENTCEFQFSEYFLRQKGVEYDSAAVIGFDKHTLQITCANEAVKKLAEELYTQAGGVYSTYDIQTLMRRVLVKAGCRRLFLRDGVYYIPAGYKETAKKIRKFLTALNFSFFCLGAGSEDVPEIVRAAINDIKKTVREFQAETITLKQEDKLSKRIARNRLIELRELQKNYMAVANSLQVDLQEILQEAGDAGEVINQIGVDSVDALIAKVQRGEAINTLLSDLVESAEPVVARLASDKKFAVDFVS